MDVDCSQRMCTKTTGRVLFLAVKLSTITTMANIYYFFFLFRYKNIDSRATHVHNIYEYELLCLILFLSVSRTILRRRCAPICEAQRNQLLAIRSLPCCGRDRSFVFTLLDHSLALANSLGPVHSYTITIYRIHGRNGVCACA